MANFLGVVHDTARRGRVWVPLLLLLEIYPPTQAMNHIARKKCMTLRNLFFSYKIKGMNAA
ncbi:hypothetical protein JCM10914A_16150 [Paenibacillus sp. JCM 10914]